MSRDFLTVRTFIIVHNFCTVSSVTLTFEEIIDIITLHYVKEVTCNAGK